MSNEKVDNTVQLIQDHYRPSGWDGTGFQDGQAEDSLEALDELTADEFEQVFEQLNYSEPTYTTSYGSAGAESVERDVRARLAQDADDDLRGRYGDIIRALESGDPQEVIDAKRDAEEPEFGDYGYERSDEGEHLHEVKLYRPKGATPTLIALIEDIEFTMQWGFDTLGARNPEAAPDFTNLLGEDVENSDGWAQLIEEHGEVKEQLETRQEEESAALEGVEFDTEDSAVLNSQVFKTLKNIKNELNEHLSREIEGLTNDGDTITESSGGPPTSEMQVPVYEKETDEDSDGHGLYFLTPEAEYRYYIRHIVEAAEKWVSEYEKAVEQFQGKAGDIDGRGGEEEGAGDTGGDTGNGVNNGNGVGNGNGGSDPGFGGAGTNGTTQNAGTTQNSAQPVNADTALEDLGEEFSDILGDSPQQSGAESGGSDLLGDSGEEKGEDSKATQDLIRDYLDGDTGEQQQGGATQTQQPQPQAAGAGFDPTSMMMPAMMMSMLPNALNANRDKDEKGTGRDEDDRRDEDREVPGPAQQSPGMAATTPGQNTQAQPVVAANPADAGPPPVVTPGTMVDYKLPDNSTVKVPQGVSDALQRQQGNPAIDAGTAYADTPAAQTVDKPWAVVDASQLRTGDVISWENHSAIVIDNGNGPHYLENGQLVKIDSSNQDHPHYGKFQNYLHPTGLDAGSVATATPEPTELPEPKITQSQPPQPPAVQAPQAT